jgi:hypothetical protein
MRVKRRLLVLTEVYSPEDFIINDLVASLKNHYCIRVITRVPTYPKGRLYGNHSNIFSKSVEEEIEIWRYPIFLNYNRKKIRKLLNVLWQPIAVAFLVSCSRYDRILAYQTGSIYTYSFLFGLRLNKSKSVIWSQDLWPEVAFEAGLPRMDWLDSFMSSATKFTLKNFTTVLSQSDGFKSYYLKKYDIESEVAYQYTTKPKQAECRREYLSKNLVYIGNLGVLQNFDAIVDFFELLNFELPETQFLDVYGSGSLANKLEEKYAKNCSIRFKGMVNQQVLVEVLPTYRFAIFSLINGPIRLTLPGRLQFLYNLNVPMIYLGDGSPRQFLEKYGGGLVYDEKEESITKFKERMIRYETQRISTPDIFNRDRIIEKFVKILN